MVVVVRCERVYARLKVGSKVVVGRRRGQGGRKDKVVFEGSK